MILPTFLSDDSDEEKVIIAFNNSKESRQLKLRLQDTPVQSAAGLTTLLGEAHGKIGDANWNWPCRLNQFTIFLVDSIPRINRVLLSNARASTFSDFAPLIIYLQRPLFYRVWHCHRYRMHLIVVTKLARSLISNAHLFRSRRNSVHRNLCTLPPRLKAAVFHFAAHRHGFPATWQLYSIRRNSFSDMRKNAIIRVQRPSTIIARIYAQL